MPSLHGKPRFLLHLHRSATQAARDRVGFLHLRPQSSPLRQNGPPLSFPLDGKPAVFHGYAMNRHLLRCRSFSSVHAAAVDPHLATEEGQNMVVESPSKSVASSTQVLEESRGSDVDGVAFMELKAGASDEGSQSARFVVEVDPDTAALKKGTEVDSTVEAGRAVPIDSIDVNEEGYRTPDSLKQLEADEVDVLLEHGIKTPALERHGSFAAADNLTQSLPMPRSVKQDMSIKDMLEEQGECLCKMQRQLDEQNSIIRSILEDVGILKSIAASREMKQADLPGSLVVLPSWPEWEAFTQHMKTLGHFKVEDERLHQDSDILTDPGCVRRAMLKFSLANKDVSKGLPNDHLEVLAKSAYATSTKKMVFSQRRLQCYLGLKVSGLGGEPITAKNVGGQFGLLDVMRLIYGTSVSAASQMGSLPDNVKSSIAHLLQKIIALTARPSDGGELRSKQAQGATIMPVDEGKHQQTATRRVQRQKDVAQPNMWKCPRCSHMNGQVERCVECSQRQPAHIDANASSESSDEDSVADKEGARKARGNTRALVQEKDTGSDHEHISESDIDDIIAESVEDYEDIDDDASTRASSKRASLSVLVKEHRTSFPCDKGRNSRSSGREKPKLMGRSSFREMEGSDSDGDNFRSHRLSREFSSSSRTGSRARGGYDNVRGETFSRRSRYNRDEDTGFRSGRPSSRAVGGRGRSRF